MPAYSESYLKEVVENQGKLFDFVSQNYPKKDTADFIEKYMTGRTRKSIDESQAYVSTMDVAELWEYFCKMIILVLKKEVHLKVLCRIG